jgi:cytochrome c oxidase subunit 1
MFKGKRAAANDWQATTLEWSAASSPPLGHGNFVHIPVVYRGPYEYSVPGYDAADFLPQDVPDDATLPPATGGGMLAAGAVAQKES